MTTLLVVIVIGAYAIYVMKPEERIKLLRTLENKFWVAKDTATAGRAVPSRAAAAHAVADRYAGHRRAQRRRLPRYGDGERRDERSGDRDRLGRQLRAADDER
jgi:hypothetical protein